MSDFDYAKKYVPLLYELLRSETPELAFQKVRELQQVEQDADMKGYTIMINANIIKRGPT